MREKGSFYFVDAMLMTPKTTTTHEVRTRALSGRPSCGWTLAKKREAGRPPSRAKAKIMRLLVVMTEMVAKARQTRGRLIDVSRVILAEHEKGGQGGLTSGGKWPLLCFAWN
jgi:hypothetical protein